MSGSDAKDTGNDIIPIPKIKGKNNAFLHKNVF